MCMGPACFRADTIAFCHLPVLHPDVTLGSFLIFCTLGFASAVSPSSLEPVYCGLIYPSRPIQMYPWESVPKLPA